MTPDSFEESFTSSIPEQDAEPYWPTALDDLLRAAVRRQAITLLQGPPGSGKSRTLAALGADSWEMFGRQACMTPAEDLRPQEAAIALEVCLPRRSPGLWILDGLSEWTSEWQEALCALARRRPDIHFAAGFRWRTAEGIEPIRLRPWEAPNAMNGVESARRPFYFAEGFLSQALARRGVAVSGGLSQMRRVRWLAWASDGLPGALTAMADLAAERGLAEAVRRVQAGDRAGLMGWLEALSRLSPAAAEGFQAAASVLCGLSSQDLEQIFGLDADALVPEWQAQGLLADAGNGGGIAALHSARRAALLGRPIEAQAARLRLYDWMQASGIIESCADASSLRHREALDWIRPRIDAVLASVRGAAEARRPGVGLVMGALWPILEAAGRNEAVIEICRLAGQRAGSDPRSEAEADFTAALAFWNLGDLEMAEGLLTSVTKMAASGLELARARAHHQLAAMAEALGRGSDFANDHCQAALRLRQLSPDFDRRLEAAFALHRAHTFLAAGSPREAAPWLDQAEEHGAASPAAPQHLTYLALRLAASLDAADLVLRDRELVQAWIGRSESRQMVHGLLARIGAFAKAGLPEAADECRTLAGAISVRHGWTSHPILARALDSEWEPGREPGPAMLEAGLIDRAATRLIQSIA